MYPDQNRVRTNRVTLRLDQYEHELLVALANYQGEQLSTLLRDMVIFQAQKVLAAPPEGAPAMGDGTSMAGAA